MGRGTSQAAAIFGVRPRTPEPAWQPAADGRGAPLVLSGATASQVDEFGSGFCHVLAVAMHRRWGWQLRVLGTPVDEYSIRPFSANVSSIRHVYCLNGEGRPVDIHGLFTDEAAIHRFFADAHELDERLVSEDIDDDLRRLRDHGMLHAGDRELDIAGRHLDRLGLDQLQAA